MSRNKKKKIIPVENSRRVIYLERRGRAAGRRLVPAGILYGTGAGCLLYCAGIGIMGYGTYFFLVWGGIGILCLGLGTVVGSRKIMSRIPRRVKMAFGALACGGLLCFCTVEGMILTQYHAEAEAGADYCIILGAQWKAEGPSEVLRRRLESAAEYLKANPDTKVIVSGGRGANEPISEAAGMYEYLTRAGIEPERILIEDKSTNTYENLIFSGRLLDRERDRVVIVTNNFHMFRALKIAEKQGFERAEGLAADSLAGMAPNNLLREFLGVLKDFAVGNL